MPGAHVLHYEIVRLLGRGGMGEVFEALDTRLGRRVALKFVAAELAADSLHMQRFEREARAAAGLTHPNIAVVYAFEVADGRPFLVMELLAGPTLRALIPPGTTLPVPQALRIARETASALAFAHGCAEPIVHRDVKPENLMFDGQRAIKLMDFGLAHAASESRLTRTGVTVGTAAYMAPETIAGRSQVASDVFALGVILHEMLAGELPFAGENALALMYSIANEPPRPLLKARPDAGEGVAALVARLLEKAPQSRLTAEQAVRALDVLLGASATSLPSADDATQPWAVSPAAPRWRMPRAGVLALLVLATLGSVAGWLALRQTATRHREAIRWSDEGMQALQRHDLVVARARFASAEKLDPRLGAAQVGLALVDAGGGEKALAAQRLATLLERRSGRTADDRALRASAYAHLAEFAIDDGNWGDAVRNLRLAMAEDSSDVGVYNQLGFALLNNGASAEAALVLENGLRRFPSVVALHKNAGLAALANGDAKHAEAEADLALAGDAAYAPAYALRARARARLGDRAGAVKDANQFLNSGPSEAARVDEVVQDLGVYGIAIRHDIAPGRFMIMMKPTPR